MQEHCRNDNGAERFAFGENWGRFLRVVDEDRIARAEASLRDMLRIDDLRGKRFLDIGSGSGLFSLAARRLGASVHSFDYDGASVACTERMRRQYSDADRDWTVEKGSVLNQDYLRALGTFDVVYSWGVLHHTGALWQALDNACRCVGSEGRLFIALYNDQGWISRYWTMVKRLYNRNAVLRFAAVVVHTPYLFGARSLVRLLSGRWKEERGMSMWYDMIDWLGGYPFEVAKPEEVLAFCQSRGFELENLKTCGGRQGCNEFVFVKRGTAG